MVKLHEKESLDLKWSNFGWFGEAFKIIMFNMFAHFWSQFNVNIIFCEPSQ